MSRRSIMIALLSLAACGDSAGVPPGEDARLQDAGLQDAGVQADGGDRPRDAAPPDGGPLRTPMSPLERDALLGADRVGDALRGRLDELDWDLAELASLVGVDLSCERPNLHLAVERQTRRQLLSRITPADVPRVVMTGCDGEAHEVFAIFASDPEPADAADPLEDVKVLELMARDRASGLYNFYALELDGTAADPGAFSVRRWVETPVDGLVLRHKGPRSALRESEANSESCQYCHVSGSPIFLEPNAFESPWIDAGEPTPAYAGFTASLAARRANTPELEEAVARGARGNVLEAYAPAIAEGTLGGTSSRLVRSVFCPNEFELANPSPGSVPPELLYDPTLAGEALSELPAPPGLEAMRRVPVRSTADRLVERWLVDEGWLRAETVAAIRLFGDASDLSRERCAIYAAAYAELRGLDRENLDAAVTQVMRSAWQLGESPNRELALALLGGDAMPLAHYRAARRAALDTEASAFEGEALVARARDRALWMKQLFDEGFALNPLVYEHWGVE